MNFFQPKFRSWTIFSIIGFIAICSMFIVYVIPPEGTKFNYTNAIFLCIIGVIFFTGLKFSYEQQSLLYNEFNDIPSFLGGKSKSIASGLTDEIRQASSTYAAGNLVRDYSSIYADKTGKYINAVSSISNLLITSGFLGTVFGLILAMSGLKGAISDSRALIHELDKVLSGIDVAFYTTLFGAFGGGIILRINLIIHKNFLQEIIVSIRHKWVKVCAENVPPQPSADFNALHKELDEKKEKLNKVFSSIAENMNLLAINFQKTNESIKSAAVSIPQQLESVAEKTALIEKSGANLSGVLNSLLKDFDTVSDKVSALKPVISENITDVFGNITSASYEIQKALPLFFDKLAQMVSNIENASGSVKDLDDNIKEAFDSIKELASSFKGTSGSVKKLETSMDELTALPAQKTLLLLADRIEQNNQVISKELRGLLGK